MDHGREHEQETHEQEFRLAIRAIPISETRLLIWEIAKTCHVMPVGRPPLNRQELQQYLGVIADFKRTTEFETPSYDTLEALATSAIAWNWDANAQREMLILSNAVRIPFPPTGEELQKTGSTAAHSPRHHRRTDGNNSSSPTPKKPRRSTRNSTISGPPTPMCPSPKPTPARPLSHSTGTGQRECTATARSATTTIGGPPTARPAAAPTPGHPRTHTRAYRVQEWLTETHTDARKYDDESPDSDDENSEDNADDTDDEDSEESYYVPDNYHSDDSGYDSNMYKKCWEDDF